MFSRPKRREQSLPPAIFAALGLVAIAATAVFRSIPGLLLVSAWAAFSVFWQFRPFLNDANTRSKTIYAVTDRRVIVLDARSRRRVVVDLSNAIDISLEAESDGRGTIWLGRRRKPFFTWPKKLESDVPAIFAVRDAVWLYERICDLHRARRRVGGITQDDRLSSGRASCRRRPSRARRTSGP